MKLKDLWSVIHTNEVVIKKAGYDYPVYGTGECDQPIEDFSDDDVVVVQPLNVYTSLGETIPILCILIS